MQSCSGLDQDFKSYPDRVWQYVWLKASLLTESKLLANVALYITHLFKLEILSIDKAHFLTFVQSLLFYN